MNKEPPDINKDIYKAIKVPLKYVIKNENILSTINDTVLVMNKIETYGMQFIKLYMLHEYEKNKKLPKLSTEFIKCALKTCCKNPTIGKKPSIETQNLKDKMKIYYDSDFKHLNIEYDLSYLHMNTLIDYVAQNILTMYENNIKQNYIDCVFKFVNDHFDKRKNINSIKENNMYTQKQKKKIISMYCSYLRKIIDDILNVKDNEYKSDPELHFKIKMMKDFIVPKKDVFEKNSIYYDLKCNSNDYFVCMLKMNKYFETFNDGLFTLFPIKKSTIPNHIKIDTTSLVHLLIKHKKHINTNYYLKEKRIKRCSDQIWNLFFRTELKCFYKKGYSFDHMINTDGISCSILLVRTDLLGKIHKPKFNKKDEEYIDELTLECYNRLKMKKIVSIDPNKGDLIYCVDGTSKNRKQFRYTQDQRRKETKSKKYRDIQLKLKEKIINEKTVIEWETELKEYNSKTTNHEKAKEHIKKKNEISEILYEFYLQEIFRKLRLNTYLNTLKSEQRMIKNFKNKFGSEKEVCICIGDWEQKTQMKYKEPTIGKGIRKIFKRNEYEIYLVYEFRTSCRCSKCEGECETFRKCKNPKPFRTGFLTRHGLVKCTTCKCLWNRDENSSNNIYKISKCAINGLERPKYLCRQKKEED